MLMRRAALPCTDVEVALPTHLHDYATRVRARISGPVDAPVLVLLGGISADRSACPDGEGAGWWPGFAEEGAAADPTRYRILGMDFVADETGRAAPTTFEQADALIAVLDHLGVGQAHAVIGASYGGMVGLALAQRYPGRVDRLVVMSAPAMPHPTATALRELQRRTVALGIATGRAEEALSIARGLAMLSYRTPAEFRARFAGGIDTSCPLTTSDAGNYLKARGKAFHSVMSPGRYLSLSASIDRHAVDPAAIRTPALLIGATSDQLVPQADLRALADALAGPSTLHLLDSLYGHDMFLKEASRVSALVAPFLEQFKQ